MAPTDRPSVISDLGKSTIFIGAYLYFMGSIYFGFYYRRLGISSRALDLSLNGTLFDAFFALKYIIGFHTRACWTFVVTLSLLVLLLNLPSSSHAWRYGVVLASVLVLSGLFLAASYQIAYEAAFSDADGFVKKPLQSLCLSFKSDLAAKVAPGFFDGLNRNQRCGLHSIVETPNLLFLFDQASKKGPPEHVFVLRRDDVALVDVTPD
jgi:hypothetical protein